jgi:hypothetical protein
VLARVRGVRCVRMPFLFSAFHVSRMALTFTASIIARLWVCLQQLITAKTGILRVNGCYTSPTTRTHVHTHTHTTHIHPYTFCNNACRHSDDAMLIKELLFDYLNGQNSECSNLNNTDSWLNRCV